MPPDEVGTPWLQVALMSGSAGRLGCESVGQGRGAGLDPGPGLQGRPADALIPGPPLGP